jgi:hypothetical protein
MIQRLRVQSSSRVLILGRCLRNAGRVGVGIRMASVYNLVTTICAKAFITYCLLGSNTV